MNAELVKKFPWLSLTLLLAAYASLGWLLSDPAISSPAWLPVACQKTFALLKGMLLVTVQSKQVCNAAAEENFLGAMLAVGWVIVASFAFMSPLTSFNRFIVRWFKSDTIAFLALCIIAGMIAFILFWLQLFLQIATILATEALARIDLQTQGLSKLQAFWILVIVSLVGLGTGWILRLGI